MIDRKKFFDSVRESLFQGVLSQRTVDGMSAILDTWEKHFAQHDIRWLSYALSTSHHETGFVHWPIKEYGGGQGKPYGVPAGPYNQIYCGHGYVQLTWLENFEKAEKILKDTYRLNCPCVQYPHRQLETEPASLVLFDGMIGGWFTGVKLADYFNEKKEDPYNARKIVNALDHAGTIENYYWAFKEALVP